MKKITFTFFAVVVFAAFASSCKKETETCFVCEKGQLAKQKFCFETKDKTMRDMVSDKTFQMQYCGH